MSAEELKNDPKFQQQAAMATALCDKVLKEYITMVYPEITFEHVMAFTDGYTLEKDNAKKSFCFAIVDKDYMLDLGEQSEGARKQFANLMTHMQGCLMMLYTLISVEDGKNDIIKGLKGDPANTTYYLEEREDHEKRIGFVLEDHVPMHKRGKKIKK
tara:strand:- start:625 stop:1095 length:471 start_codon:yes stop_codon:yes gene_type:complete